MQSNPLILEIRRLAWTDPEHGRVEVPKGAMRLSGGFGSGLSIREGDPPGHVWAVCDRGPNFKLKTAVERFGLTSFEGYDGPGSAKIMPRLDIGPALAGLRVEEDRVVLVRTIRMAGGDGEPISGLPIPASGHAQCEPALDLAGGEIAPDPEGVDSEGVTALADGSFWVADEYGPSLLRLDGEGRVMERLMPTGVALEGADYPCRETLPAIAAKRQLNRGFEGVSVSPSEKWLFLAFQSPLAHPDEGAHEQGRHVRIWRLDAASMEVKAQYLYPLDAPETFRLDVAKGEFGWSDLKVSEIASLGEDDLIVLERGSETTKIYCVTLGAGCEVPDEHLGEVTRPTIEEMSGRAALQLPVLDKRLLFSSDEAPEVSADLEGMAILSPTELLLVSDNDFGVEGAETSFWRLRFAEPVLAP